jgi:biopolymer transport protein ExbD
MPMKTTADQLPEMNVIPMVDIMFNLLIFFLATTTFQNMEQDLALQVPAVAGSSQGMTAAPERRIVNVYESGAITLDGSPVSLEELSQQLAATVAQYRGLGVLVRGDADGRFQRVAEVLNACKRAGIEEMAISVRLLPPGEMP